MEIVTIEPDNYQSYLPLDVVAFHYTATGACGYHGVLVMLTADKHLYMVQYLADDWKETDLHVVCPPLKDLQVGIFGYHITPDNWTSYYMGLGNTLFLKMEIAAKLDLANKSPLDVYDQWVTMILEQL